MKLPLRNIHGTFLLRFVGVFVALLVWPGLQWALRTWHFSYLWVFCYYPVLVIVLCEAAFHAASRVEYVASSLAFCAFGMFAAMDLWMAEPAVQAVEQAIRSPLLSWLIHGGGEVRRLTEYFGLLIGVLSFGVASNLLSHALTIKFEGIPGPLRRYGSPLVITSKYPIEVQCIGRDGDQEVEAVLVRLSGKLILAERVEHAADKSFP